MTDRARPPGPRGCPVLGHLAAFRRDTTGFLQRTARAHGDISRFRLLRDDVYLLNRPEYVREALVTRPDRFRKGRTLQRAKALLGEGLLTSEGAYHRRQRRLLQPFFHPRELARYGPAIVEEARLLARGWKTGEVVDIAREMTRVMMHLSARILLGTALNAHADRIEGALRTITRLFPLLTLPKMERLDHLPIPPFSRFRHARDYLRGVIDASLSRAKAAERPGPDVASRLVHDPAHGNGGTPSDGAVRDELLALFMAGHETTAIALTWTWYLLSRHPNAEAALHWELDAVLGGRLPTAADEPRLRYTRMVFAEAMRLYPPVGRIGRRPIEDMAIGGHVIPARALVFVSPYVTQRDPRYFADPDTFEPARWARARASKQARFTYFPFGAGQRQCIGEGLAWLVGVLLVATIAREWTMRRITDEPAPVETLITLRPRGGMWMELQRRRATAPLTCA